MYITNIVRCRPPNNRDPLPKEIKACIPYLKEQIKSIKPKFIVGVGRISASKIIPEDFKITRDHGKIYTLKNGIRVMGVYHPAFILRNRKLTGELLNDLILLKNNQ